MVFAKEKLVISLLDMCISNQNLHQVVEIIAVILLTLSVVTIGTSLNFFGSIIEKMTSAGKNYVLRSRIRDWEDQVLLNVLLH